MAQSPTPPRILRRIDACVRGGDIDEGLKSRRALDAAAARPGGDVAFRARLQARAAQFHLLMMDKYAAARSLAPYVDMIDGRNVRVSEAELDTLAETGGLYVLGSIQSQIANLMNSCFRYEHGAKLAQSADQLMAHEGDLVTELDRRLAQCENNIWRARLLSHCGRVEDAEGLLRGVLRSLADALEWPVAAEDATKGGIDLLAALTLDLSASLDLRAGRLDEGRRKIYQALFLLRGGRVRCTVRLAHALYMAARIEVSYGHTAKEWCLYLFDEAVERFRRMGHPFQFRTLVQKAQFFTRFPGVHDAEEVLAAVDRGLQLARRRKQIHPDEEGYVRADQALTRVWILERKARQNPQLWTSCVDEARRLVAHDPKPHRLGIEGELHLGYAMIHSTSSDERKRGREILETCLIEARRSNLRKIEAAAHFALSESYLDSGGKRELCEGHFDLGAKLAAGMRSAFLQSWRESLQRTLQRPGTIEIQLNQTLPQAEEELKRKFMQYAARGTRTNAELFDRLGLPHGPGYRLKKHLKAARSLRRDANAGTTPGLDRGHARGDPSAATRAPRRPSPVTGKLTTTERSAPRRTPPADAGR